MPARGGMRHILLSCLSGLSLLAATATHAAEPIKGDRELGEYLSSMCVACHQLSGKVTQGIPGIVAWPEESFVAVIESYKDGTRDNETMRTISHRLSLEEIAALAAYFGSLPAPK